MPIAAISPVLRSRFICALLAAALALPALLPAAAPLARSAGESRAPFPHSIREVPTTATNTSGKANHAYISRMTLTDAEAAAPMTFEVALGMRNFAELETRLAHSEIISRDEMQARYFPLAADRERVRRWLESEGLTITSAPENNLAVFARAPVSEVARIFQTQFARVTSEGREYTSAIAAPSLPGSLGRAVAGIHGLQPHQRLKRLGTAPQPQLQGAGYFPAQIAKAYNTDSLNLDGTGQTIAIYSFGYPNNNDMLSFWTLAGMTHSFSSIDHVDVAGGPTAPSIGPLAEATLDVQWVSALAPGARIRIYAADENDPVGDDELIQQVLADLPSQPGLHQFTISYGLDESVADRDYVAIEAQYMATLVSAGVTVFASSGDNGALDNEAENIEVGVPAAMPDVTAVGGTNLSLATDGSYQGETAWGSITNRGDTGASGGGISKIFNRPSWQNGPGVIAGSTRLVPDVAALGDPVTGALTVFKGVNSPGGGTSLSAPMWAAWCALLNQARAAAGKAPLGALNPRLYPLAGTAVFHDIITGGNSVYRAGAGYDMCTGLGSPDMKALLAAVTADNFAPVIEMQSGDRFTTVGQGATFYVIGTGSPTPTTRWQRLPAGTSTWIDLTDDSTYTGTSTFTISVYNATLAMQGDQFRCTLQSSAGTVTAVPMTLNVGVTGVSTLAGWPSWSGSVDGRASAGRFNYLTGLCTDKAGNVYVTDAAANTIRKITPAGVVTTIAGTAGTTGSADGNGPDARFNGPEGLVIDNDGNLYIADAFNYTIRKLTPDGTVITIAGRPGKRGHTDGAPGAATFYDPEDLVFDKNGNIFVADGDGNEIRKIAPDGTVSTFAGTVVSGTDDGVGSAARFDGPYGITIDPSGNLWVSDFYNNAIREITPDGTVTTVAGKAGYYNYGFADGTAAKARFSFPLGLVSDPNGNIYVADSYNNAIRKVTPAGVVTTVSGNPSLADNVDGPLGGANFYEPFDVAIDPSGILYIADSGDCTVRRIVLTATAGAPTILAQPASTTIDAGKNTTLTVAAQGSDPLTYQWQQMPAGATTWSNLVNSASFTGVTTSALTIASASVALDGAQFRCLAQNAAGSATSSAATLFVLGAPAITAPSPVPVQTVLAGASYNLTVNAAGRNLTYQWQFNGQNISGATTATWLVYNFDASSAGTYSVVVTNSYGSTTAKIVTLSFAPTYLTNLSVRAAAGGPAGPLTVGFVLAGSGTARILVRGDGPGLAQFGLGGVLANPSLTLSSSTATVAVNTGWANDPALSTAFGAVGAFAFPANSADTALLVPLAPGNYTAQINGINGSTGVALAELYYADTASISTRPVNVSALTNVGTGANVLAAGFVVSGPGTEKLLIRAIGPTLANFGVGSPLARPILTVLDSAGKTLASNSGWASDPTLATVFSQVGAFGLALTSVDAAVVVTVPAGGYTAQVAGLGNTTGSALIEIYEVK